MSAIQTLARTLSRFFLLSVLLVPWTTASQATEPLYNSIVLPSPWPPQPANWPYPEPITPPYLESPPAVIPIDVGRQSSDVPHYWYREFDLDLGNSKGNIHFGKSIWSRQFENAMVTVNPGKVPAEFSWESSTRYCDVRINPLASPITLQPRTAMLLMRFTPPE